MRYLSRAAALALIAASVVVASGCSALGQGDLGRKAHITADFRSIAGIFVGNPVTVLGLDVGKVDSIVPHSEYIEVHLSVDPDVQIPRNVVAALISPSIVTDRHIELTPRYTGGPTLPADAHLTVEQTRTPVELDTLITTIDRFTAALGPQPGAGGGPLSGTTLYDMVHGQGAKIRDTLTALSGALRVGVDNKDAVSTIVIKLNELTGMLADNDQSVRDFSAELTQMSQLLAQQAPGLQATLDQMNDFLADTSTTFSRYQDRLASSLTGLTEVTRQLRRNAEGVTETVDLAPLTLQNFDRAIDRNRGFIRTHAVLGTFLSGEVIGLFCQRIQMKSDGCRTGKIEDFGPDLGLTAALLGLTK